MKTQILLCLVVVLLGCSGCTHYYYAANELHLARVSEVGDFKVSGALASKSKIYAGDRLTNLSVSATGSPFRHLAVAFNHTNITAQQLDAGITLPRGSGQLTAFALGTYYSLTTPEREFSVLADFYTGYAWGNATNEYTDFSTSRVRFQRPYLQLGLHLAHQDVISLGVGLRVAKLAYDDISFFAGTTTDTAPPELFYLRNHSPTRLTDWAFQLQVGPSYAKTFVSFTTSNAPNAPDLKYLDKVFALGLLLEVDEFFRKPSPSTNQF